MCCFPTCLTSDSPHKGGLNVAPTGFHFGPLTQAANSICNALMRAGDGMSKEESRNLRIDDAFSSHGILLALAYETWGEEGGQHTCGELISELCRYAGDDDSDDDGDDDD
jgi:hypothetical protein